jgi:hypothetical protein
MGGFVFALACKESRMIIGGTLESLAGKGSR